jgi:hypothetical protein
VASGQQQLLVFEFGFSENVRQKSLPNIQKTGATPVITHHSPWRFFRAYDFKMAIDFHQVKIGKNSDKNYCYHINVFKHGALLVVVFIVVVVCSKVK